MDKAAKRGEIFVIEEVVTELKRKDDSICNWVLERDSMIVPIDAGVQRHLAMIMSKYGRLVDTRKSRSGGDPWVIALALERGLTVVTGEKASGNLNKPKIPDVSKDLGVACVGIVDFFRMQGWQW